MNVNGPHFTGGSHAGSGKERGTVLIRDGRKALPGAECLSIITFKVCLCVLLHCGIAPHCG